MDFKEERERIDDDEWEGERSFPVRPDCKASQSLSFFRYIFVIITVLWCVVRHIHDTPLTSGLRGKSPFSLRFSFCEWLKLKWITS